jgi:hypothetical protein
MSLDLDYMPDLQGESESLRHEDIHMLGGKLPPRLVGASWRPVFRTSHHGFSLRSLYRKFQNERAPALLVIEDTDGSVFGALLTHPIRESETFYGTGESFLFTCRPRWNCWKWAGHNNMFVRGNSNELTVGASNGHFGIWLDSNLDQGRTEACETFGNEPLTKGFNLKGDFTVKSVECWTFD